jgi:hypothetical protein
MKKNWERPSENETKRKNITSPRKMTQKEEKI